MKKTPRDIIILQLCTINDVSICMVPEIWKFFCHFGPFFALLHPLLPKNQKNQHFEKREKNDWRYYHFPHVYHK